MRARPHPPSPVPRFGRPLFRSGLSGTFGLNGSGCRQALERIECAFWSPRMKGLTPALHDAVARDRGRCVVATGPLIGLFPGALRTAVERGPLSPEEDAWMRAIGRAVHG